MISHSATNTETVCESGVVRHLLGILQWEGLDGHAQLSIVMCLSMLTEDRGINACEVERERERERDGGREREIKHYRALS